MPLATGTRLGAYAILGPLGAGGMGEVYRARDSRLDRTVAVKVLPEHLAGDAALRARFEREAKAVAALSHPHILAIHDFGTEDGIAYAVMELLEGQGLRERLQAGALPARKAVEFAVQIARGLAAAHEKGVVHRDLKPENLFVTSDGRIKILDFGLARYDPAAADNDHSPTVTRETDPGTVMGTVGYMPEQVRGAAVDPRTRVESPDSKPLPLGEAEVLAVSSGGELALSLGHRFNGWMGEGTLARAPMLGAAGRPITEGVREADWSPDGSALAVVRRVENRERLEFPLGKVLYDTAGYIAHIRVSTRGDRIAFADHPIWADDLGSVAVVDLAGKKTTLTGDWSSLRGIAWSPGGDEVWFTANAGSENTALRAVDLHGAIRPLLSGLTHHLLFDVSREGRVLLGRETSVRHLDVQVPGTSRPVQVPYGTSPSPGSWRLTAVRSWSRIRPPRATRSSSITRTARLPFPWAWATGSACLRTASGCWRSRPIPSRGSGSIPPGRESLGSLPTRMACWRPARVGFRTDAAS